MKGSKKRLLERNSDNEVAVRAINDMVDALPIRLNMKQAAEVYLEVRQAADRRWKMPGSGAIHIKGTGSRYKTLVPREVIRADFLRSLTNAV